MKVISDSLDDFILIEPLSPKDLFPSISINNFVRSFNQGMQTNDAVQFHIQCENLSEVERMVYLIQKVIEPTIASNILLQISQHIGSHILLDASLATYKLDRQGRPITSNNAYYFLTLMENEQVTLFAGMLKDSVIELGKEIFPQEYWSYIENPANKAYNDFVAIIS